MSKKEERPKYDPSGTIAMFIAAALQHLNPPCNGNNPRMSTIVVSQYKNKFDQVVVYCTLAERNEVAEAWAEEGKDGEPTHEYRGKRMLHDAQVYRSAYRKMIFLVPQYKKMILSRPDYGYLLFDTVAEAHAWLDKEVEEANKSEAHENYRLAIQSMLKHWDASSIDDLKAKLTKVYEYTW